MSKVLLDSDMIIWHLRGRKEVTAVLKDIQRFGLPACSALSILEVQAGVKKGEEEKTDHFLNALKVFDVNRDISNRAGRIVREYRSKGITLDLPDAVIAATCIQYDLILITGNRRHYPIPELEFYPFAFRD